MSDLMIGNGKRFRDGRVQQFATVLLPHRHKSGVAKRAIDVDRTVDFGNAVFRQHDNGSSAGARRIGKIAGDRIDFGQRFSDRGMGFIRTEALQIIIQMGQIGQCEGRIILGHDKLSRVRNPPRRCDRRCRPPELKQWKGPKALGQAIP